MRMLSVSFRADVLTEGKCPSFSGCRIGIFCEGGCDRSCLGLGTLYRMFQTCGGRNRSAPSGRHSRLLHRPLSTNHQPLPILASPTLWSDSRSLPVAVPCAVTQANPGERRFAHIS